MLHELPHLGSLGVPMSPELGGRRHLVGVAALGAALEGCDILELLWNLGKVRESGGVDSECRIGHRRGPGEVR